MSSQHVPQESKLPLTYLTLLMLYCILLVLYSFISWFAESLLHCDECWLSVGQHTAASQHKSLHADQRRRHQARDEALHRHQSSDLVLETQRLINNQSLITNLYSRCNTSA